MPLVTVIGASSRMFAVTVDGTHAFRLKKQYENAINNLQGVGKNSTVGGGASLPTLDGGSHTAIMGVTSAVPLTGSITVGNDHVDDKMLLDITTMSTVSGSSATPVPGNSLGTVPGAAARLTVGGSEAIVGYDNKDHVKVAVSGASSIVHDDPAGLYQHNNFTFDTTNGTVSGDWGDTISAVGDPKVYPEESANISVGGPLAFIGGEQLDDKRNIATVNGGTQYLDRRVQDVRSDASSIYSGTEEPNIFDFVNSRSGNYTIADFSKAAGNKVGQSDISKILFNDSSHAVKGSPTLTLDDGTKITFSAMTDGKSIDDDEFYF